MCKRCIDNWVIVITACITAAIGKTFNMEENMNIQGTDEIGSKKIGETFKEPKNIYTAFGSIDVVTGNKAVTIDTKLIIPLHNGFGIFNRNTIHEPYNEDGEFFHVSQIRYNIIGNLYTVIEANIGSDVPLRSEGGVLYVGSFLQGKMFFLSTAQIGFNNNPHLFWETELFYMPKLTDTSRFIIGVDNQSLVNKNGHIESIQRCRLGVDYKGFQFGIALDFTETGKKMLRDDSISYNYGVFIKKPF